MTKDDLLKWVFPNEREFVGHAFSQDHLDELTACIAADRQAFLGGALMSELARREGRGVMLPVPTHSSSPNFEDIPLGFAMSRSENREIGSNCTHYDTAYDANRHWNTLMEFYAALGGFRVWATKYDDFHYDYWRNYAPGERRIAQNEKHFQEAYERSKSLSNAGFDLRFLMDGVSYIYSAYLDLGTIERNLELKEPAGGGLGGIFARPTNYWRAVVKAKKKIDKEKGHSCFADVVCKLGDGLYAAPYYPKELKDSGQYITIDDIWLLNHELGYADHVSTRAFRNFVLSAARDEKVAAAIKHAYFSPTPQKQAPGVLFFGRNIMPELVERLAACGVKETTGTMKIARILAEDADEYKEYQELVFPAGY